MVVRRRSITTLRSSLSPQILVPVDPVQLKAAWKSCLCGGGVQKSTERLAAAQRCRVCCLSRGEKQLGAVRDACIPRGQSLPRMEFTSHTDSRETSYSPMESFYNETESNNAQSRIKRAKSMTRTAFVRRWTCKLGFGIDEGGEIRGFAHTLPENALFYRCTVLRSVGVSHVFIPPLRHITPFCVLNTPVHVHCSMYALLINAHTATKFTCRPSVHFLPHQCVSSHIPRQWGGNKILTTP